MKELIITAPEGYEIDKEKSTFEKIIFKETIPTYGDIAKKLFMLGHFYTNEDGEIYYLQGAKVGVHCPNNSFSKEALKAMLARNKLANVARYLNGDWQMDNQSIYYSLAYNRLDNKIKVSRKILNCNIGDICFESEELARKAIQILGEEEVKIALQNLY